MLAQTKLVTLFFNQLCGSIGGCFSVPFTVDLDSTLSYGDYPTGRQDWNISATSTASRLLQFTSVARALFSKEKMDSSLSTSLQNYGASLPRGLAHSSFTFLAKYWQDQSGKKEGDVLEVL